MTHTRNEVVKRAPHRFGIAEHSEGSASAPQHVNSFAITIVR